MIIISTKNVIAKQTAKPTQNELIGSFCEMQLEDSICFFFSAFRLKNRDDFHFCMIGPWPNRVNITFFKKMLSEFVQSKSVLTINLEHQLIIRKGTRLIGRLRFKLK